MAVIYLPGRGGGGGGGVGGGGGRGKYDLAPMISTGGLMQKVTPHPYSPNTHGTWRGGAWGIGIRGRGRFIIQGDIKKKRGKGV